MTLDNIDDLFQESDDVTRDKLILEMLDPKNVIMKTEIPNPMAITRLRMYQYRFEEMKFKKTAAIIQKFCDDYLIHMVSYERKRAGEIERMIIGTHKEAELTSKEKLLGGKEE